MHELILPPMLGMLVFKHSP